MEKKQSAREHAEYLHQKHCVFDAHFDLLSLVLEKREKGEKSVIKTKYLSSFNAANVDVVISSLFVSSRYLPEMGLRRALNQVSALHCEMEETPGLFSLCRNTAEIDEARKRGEIAILLSLEGADPLGNDLSLLRIFFELGVRGLGLVWSRRNYAGDGAFFSSVREGRKGGLTEFGIRLAEEAIRLGMYLDVSHLNDEGLEDLFSMVDIPLMASHSNCRALAPSMRNLRDEQICTLAARGGIMGMNTCSTFVGDPDKKTMTEKDLADHVDHIWKLAGKGHVGLGFDFCDEMRDFSKPGPHRNYDCIKGYPASVDFTAELVERGYADEEIRGILGKNFMDFLKKTIG